MAMMHVDGYIYLQANGEELQENGAMFNLTVFIVSQCFEEMCFGSGSGT